jgi:hypothetical protein
MLTMNIHELRLKHESAWQASYPHFIRLIRDRGLESGIEVGVGFGGHAEAILDQTPVAELVGVDPYEHRADYDDPMNLPQEQFENLFWYAMGRLSRFGARYGHLRAFSTQAAPLITEQADFVYLDADHSYANVAADLNLWFPKVRPGGIIGGHDYALAQFPGVKQAVDEFCAVRRLRLHVEPDTVWWVEIPTT